MKDGNDLPLVLIVSIREDWVQHMVATSIVHYYKGPARIVAVTMKRANEWAKLIPKAALVVPLYWFLAQKLEALGCPRQKMLISIRGVSGKPNARVPRANQTVLRFCRHAAGVLCANASLMREWKQANYAHVYLGHSAVDLRYWHPSVKPRDHSRLPLIAGWTGNSTRPDKRVHSFFIPAVRAAGDDVRPLVQCGYTNFIPWEQMAERFYHRIDALCITSTGEGTPNPCLEAMACGVPVISTKVGHVPEVLQHKRCGWIINSPSELANCLRRLAADPELRRWMGQNAIERAKEWAWEKKIELWKHAIEHTLKRLKR